MYDGRREKKIYKRKRKRDRRVYKSIIDPSVRPLLVRKKKRKKPEEEEPPKKRVWIVV